MTRQIKFRGKRTDNGEWVYGYYVSADEKHYIFTGQTGLSQASAAHAIMYRDFVRYEVIPETVGQFTGLHDKNGKEIYEGDICSLITENGVKINVVCRFGSAHRLLASGCLCDIVGFYFQRDDDLKSFPIVCNYKGVHDTKIMEVIGNIHDNPDLLTTK
jgi:uncharacterized phage protein (TIGR01671 family)